MLPDRTYTRARQHVFKTVDKYVHAALESNAKDVLNGDSVANCGQHKRYILLNELVERAKDPIVLRDKSTAALLGGTETTASLLSNLLYLLSRRPEVWQQLRAEALGFGDKAINSRAHEGSCLLVILHQRVLVCRNFLVVAHADRKACSIASISHRTIHHPLV